MFARLVEATAKPGKREEISSVLLTELLPKMQKSPGFAGMVGLFSDTDANDGGGISLWETKEDAEAFYKSADYLNLLGRLKPLIVDMKVRTFNVTRSTFQKTIASGA